MRDRLGLVFSRGNQIVPVIREFFHTLRIELHVVVHEIGVEIRNFQRVADGQKLVGVWDGLAVLPAEERGIAHLHAPRLQQLLQFPHFDALCFSRVGNALADHRKAAILLGVINRLFQRRQSDHFSCRMVHNSQPLSADNLSHLRLYVN